MRGYSTSTKLRIRKAAYLFGAVATTVLGGWFVFPLVPAERLWPMLGLGAACGVLAFLADFAALPITDQGVRPGFVPAPVVGVVFGLWLVISQSLGASSRAIDIIALGFGVALLCCYPLWVRRWKLSNAVNGRITVTSSTEATDAPHPGAASETD